MIDQRAPNPDLSPLPVRLLVYAALVLIALASIRVIDHHVMARADVQTSADMTGADRQTPRDKE